MTIAGLSSLTQPSNDWQPPADGLIAREAELSRFAAILQRDRPALVALLGDIGAGKSTLLLHVRALAGARPDRWTVIPSGSLDDLSVDAATTEDSFVEQIARAIGADQPSTPSSPALPPIAQPVEQLRSRAPVLMLVDGFHPSGRFARWFAETFVPEVRQAGANVVIVVSAAPNELAALAPLADDRIELRALDPGVIREHFGNIGRRLSPPMSAAELDAYVQSGCQTPDLIPSLTRMLWLARPAQ